MDPRFIPHFDVTESINRDMLAITQKLDTILVLLAEVKESIAEKPVVSEEEPAKEDAEIPIEQETISVTPQSYEAPATTVDLSNCTYQDVTADIYESTFVDASAENSDEDDDDE